jgi:2-methylcitrate dehydratase PrpD
MASDKVSALRLLAGWSSRSGIEAAILAQKGFSGVRNVLQGFHGFYRIFTGDEPDLNILTDQLGKRFEVSRLQFKYYPSCGTTIAATYAALGLAKEFAIDFRKIDRITVETAEFTNSISGHTLTFSFGDIPDPVEGQYSQPYTVANALVRRSSQLKHFTPEYMTDPEVLALAAKVIPVLKCGIPEISARVEIEMKDGKRYSRLVHPRDMPRRNSFEQVREKFRECVAFAPRSLPEENTGKIVRMVERLEEVEDISELVSLLVPA